MKWIALLVTLLCRFVIFSQEVLAPIELKLVPTEKNQTDVLKSTIDSTFIFIPDTLKLPVFDEFSKNKFQDYTKEVSGPNTTTEKYFSLLNQSDLPLSPSIKLVNFKTYKYVINGKDTTKTELVKQKVKFSDLTQYPVTYVSFDAYPPYSIYDSIGTLDQPDTVFNFKCTNTRFCTCF